MRTLFLGSYGFGNLGDELCLVDAMRAFPSSEAWAFTVDPVFTGNAVRGLSGFIRYRREIPDLAPQRVVLGGGGVGFFPSIRDMLHWMYDAFRLGAECHIHNIGVARMEDLSWAEVNEVQTVLTGLTSCSVRDDISAFCMGLWPGSLKPAITYYPERTIDADTALVTLLPKPHQLLGISITGQILMRRALKLNCQRVIRKLSMYNGWTVVPIISTVSLTDSQEDDIAGFEYFRRLYLEDFNVACEQFLDRSWWRENMTPSRLKGLIGAINVLITQRKHNLIHAIGTQTQVVGIYPSIDDSIARIFFTLRDMLPPDSTQLSLTVSL